MWRVSAACVLTCLAVLTTAGLNAEEAGTPAPLGRCDQLYASAVKDFETFVAKHSTCVSDADCTIARARCPLPCGSAVNQSFESQVEDYADALVQRLYERDKCLCKYRCMSPRGARCVNKICVALRAR